MRSIEEKYQQLEHREHVYKLPDTYIGSVEPVSGEMFVIASSTPDPQITKRNVTYVPGFLKIFDEILVNAIDHRQRDSTVKNIRVTLKKGQEEIVIQNDGQGIDVAIHTGTQLYVPEMLFGHLLTSSNYTEGEQRTTGGKNGYGAKLVGIFSRYFIVETVDSNRQLKYNQQFTENNKNILPPKITKNSSKPYTKITFVPDYQKFGLNDGITDELYDLLARRVYDVTAVTPDDLNVYLNGTRIKVKTMDKYIQLYLQPYQPTPKVYFVEYPRWKIGLVLSPEREFTQISFVNGIWTMKGGRHVDYVLNQIMDRIKTILARSSKTRNKNIKPSQIKDHIWLFVDCIIVNPAFTSQTKEEMTTKVSQFGSTCSIEEAWVEKWMKSTDSSGDSFMERMVESLQIETDKTLKKTDGSKKSVIRGIPKLEDAIYAGTRRSGECTLILTEGDSAKSSILAGLSVFGTKCRDTFGVFPLRGKFINVRDTNLDKVSSNEEVKNLKTILGLQQGKVYTQENIKELRYGSVALATDQDCFVQDTPLLIQYPDGRFGIQSIDDLVDEWVQGEGGYFCGQSKYKVWSDQGWTDIVKVVKKRTSKKIFRVLTHTGCVEVTEDHPLLTQKGITITPKNCALGTGLLHHFPKHFDHTGSKIIDEDEGYKLGTLHSFYMNEWKQANGTDRAIIRYRSLFYDRHGRNRIPDCILNASRKIRERFRRGIENGAEIDELRDLHVRGKLGTQGLFCLYKSLGYNIGIALGTEEDTYRIVFVTGQSMSDQIVQKVVDLGYTDQYVYDLETSTHHLQAGIGQLIVHNCDGSHIKALILNFIHMYWPSLLQIDGFIKSYITPIVKGFRGKETVSFYTLKDYNEFKQTHIREKWTYKYYKGLGTSTGKEFRDYFGQISDMTKYYKWDSDEALVMAFSKTLANQRKEWLKVYDPQNTIEYQNGNQILLTDFIHKDLKHFSNYDNIRSIPNVLDGLKPSQRKVLYGICKKGKGEIKVAQLASYVSEQTSYHHGEVSLEQTIVGLAQGFVGKSNLPLLQAKGQFGSRLQGGSDHAQSRYIFTELFPYTRILFHEFDDPLLEYNEEESKSIEPKVYYPILPWVLVSGIVGIGTGYSTSIPNFNPKEILQAIRERNLGKTDRFKQEWIPWYRGFAGKIEPTSDPTKFNVWGVYTLNGSKLIVTELPIGVWTQPYKEHLDHLAETGWVSQYTDKSTDETVWMDITLTDKALSQPDVLPQQFKLVSKLALNNMHTYRTDPCAQNYIHKFERVEDILEYYYTQRLEKYRERKEYMLKCLNERLLIVQEKIRFIGLVTQQPEIVFHKTRAKIQEELIRHKFVHTDALLALPIYAWSDEKVKECEREHDRIQSEIKQLQGQTPCELWNKDLAELEPLLPQ
jgi:DNA gyrase/topoisomerase IV subunit B